MKLPEILKQMDDFNPTKRPFQGLRHLWTSDMAAVDHPICGSTLPYWPVDVEDGYFSY
jgi:hypothetical protein